MTHPFSERFGPYGGPERAENVRVQGPPAL